ncbi:MAG: histidine phosphatase family protein [Thiolinea sp.]
MPGKAIFPHVILQKHIKELGCWWSDPSRVTPPDGESLEHFRRRVLKGWDQLLSKQQGKQILLVTHPGVVRLLVSEVLAIPSHRFFAIHVEHGALSRIRVVHDEGGRWASLVSHGCGS